MDFTILAMVPQNDSFKSSDFVFLYREFQARNCLLLQIHFGKISVIFFILFFGAKGFGLYRKSFI
jgi:hypothetical protein